MKCNNLSQMSRIMIIGSPGSGKSTCARYLSTITGITVHHLDQLWWKPNWIESSEDEFERNIEPILKEEKWIMDGNYSFNFLKRVKLADTIIWLDVPRWICITRILWRFITHIGQSRSDMTQNCDERIDYTILKHIWKYRESRFPILKKIIDDNQDKNIFILKNTKNLKQKLNKTL